MKPKLRESQQSLLRISGRSGNNLVFTDTSENWFSVNPFPDVL